MSNIYMDEEIECQIIESYGIFSQGIKFWNKEVNLVSWNGKPAKLDIRAWRRDHQRCGKGIALTREEAEELVRLLDRILKRKAGYSGDEGRASKQKQGTRSGAGKNTGTEDGYGTGKKTGASSGSGASQKPGASSKPRASAKPNPPKTLEPFYRELKLSLGAGPDECKTARNTLLKKYHPDINTGNIASATRKTIKIKEAYERILAWWNENDR